MNKGDLAQVWVQKGYWVPGKTQSVGMKPYKTFSSFSAVVAYNDQVRCHSLWLVYHHFQPFSLILNWAIIITPLNEISLVY